MLREPTKDELWLKASGYCAKSEHCRREVHEKLWQWGCNDESVREQILNDLEADNYIDEQRYCNAYVHDKVAYQGWGRIKIKMMLMTKGINEEYINISLSQINKQDYTAALRKVLERYPDDRNRQFRLALQRGFEYSEITSLL